MPTTVEEFVKGKLPVVAVTLEQSLDKASRLMIEHDYSQLPVINSERKPIGAITSDSILKALANYGVALDELRIKHVMQRNPRLFLQDIDLLDLFDDMDGTYVFIVNETGRLVQVITGFDTTEYFQQRASDILLVENIENTIKDYVQLAFDSLPEGEDKLDSAIQSMTNSTLAQKKKFSKALRNYLGRKGIDNSLDDILVEEVFQKQYGDETLSATFDQLTLAQYIALFLFNDYWSQLEAVFELPKSAVVSLLESVRKTRNELAHFREISRDQSYQLRDCYDLLVGHQDAINEAFVQDDKQPEVAITPEDKIGQNGEIKPVADEPAKGESRYAPLAIWLQEQPAEKNLVKPSFSTIEEIIRGKLPDSAYKNRTWWANYDGNTHSREWLEVGWRIASVNMSGQVARFARIKERQKAYIEFYGALLNDMRQQPGFEKIHPSPDGGSWANLRYIRVNSQGLATLSFAFGRGRIFRVELYIDSGNRDINKQLFDTLYEDRKVIEGEFGDELSWHRLDNRRASRVSRIFKGHITDNKAELIALHQKAVPAMVRFAQVIKPSVVSIGKGIL